MDIFTGISSTGLYMNNKSVPGCAIGSLDQSTIKRTNINGQNIYNSKNYRHNKNYVDNVAWNRYMESKNPMRTGVVPNFYNQQKAIRARNPNKMLFKYGTDVDSIFSDDSNTNIKQTNKNQDNNSINLNQDHMALFKGANQLLSTSPVLAQCTQTPQSSGKKQMNTNTFLEQFDDIKFDNQYGPVSSNNINPNDQQFNGNFTSYDLHDTSGMTYGIFDENKLTHNNMVPFFKSGIGKGYGPDTKEHEHYDNIAQRKVDLYTGSPKDLNYRPKTERKPLFNPQIGQTWIYGMPNFTDYMEMRYVPGKERRNELLQQPTRITPGLNLGYNEVSKQGFGDTYRVLPPGVDELRTANDPKISYGQPIIYGLKGENRAIVPNMAKHRPITFKEQDPEDFVRSLGYYRGPSITGNYDVPGTARQETTTEWHGPANANYKQTVAFDMLANIPDSTIRDTTQNRNWVNGPVTEYKRPVAFDMQTNIPDPTRRDTTQDRNWLNGPGTEYKRPIAFDMQTNIQDPTRRDQTQDRNWLNHANTEYKRPMAFDMLTNIPDSTIRDTTQDRNWLNGPVTEYKRPMAFDMQSNIPDTTIRDTTQNLNWLNQANTEYKRPMAFDMNTNIPDTTLRQLTQNNNWCGNIGTDYNRPQAFDMYTNIPDTTKRELIENFNTLGNITTDYNRPQAFDMLTNIPDTTKKELIQDQRYITQCAPYEQLKGSYQVNVQNTQAPNTLRQLTQDQRYIQSIGSNELLKGAYQVDVQNTQAPATLRQLIQNNTYLSQVSQPSYDKGAYQVDVQNTQAPATLRQLTQSNTQLNPIGPTERAQGAYSIDVQNTHAPNTLRQLIQSNTYLNPSNPADRAKGAYQVDVQNTHAPNTLRQLTQSNTYVNPANPSDRAKGAYQVDVQNTQAPNTLRQLTQNTNHLNPIGTNEHDRGSYQVNVQNTVAPPTLRQLTQNTTHLNPVGNRQLDKGAYQVDVQNTVAAPTLRQLTQTNTYLQPADFGEGYKQRARNDVDNMIMNVSRDNMNHVRDGGAPTTSNYEIGPMMDYTMMHLCEPINIVRDLYGQAYNQNQLAGVDTIYTRQPEPIQEANDRIDTYTPCNLRSNPYINNVMHKSVDF